MEFQEIQGPVLPDRLDHILDAHPGETGKLEHVGAQNYQRYFPFKFHQQLIGVLMVQPQFDPLLGQPLDFPLDFIQEFIIFHKKAPD